MGSSLPRLLALAFVSLAFGTNLFAVVGLLGLLAETQAVSVPEAGQVQTAFVLVGALAGPPLAILTRRVDRKRVLVGAVVLLGLASLACAVVEGFGGLLAARAAAGLAGALVSPLSIAMVGFIAPPERRGVATAMVMLGLPVSLLTAIPAQTALGAAYGWRASFLFAAGLALAAALAVQVLLPRAPAPEGRPPPLSRASLGSLAPLWAVTGFSFVANFCLTSYQAPIAIALSGVEPGRVGLFQMAIGAGSIAGILLGGRAADRDAGLLRLSAGLLAIAVAQAVAAAAFAGPHPSALGGAALAVGLFAGAAAMFSLMPVVQVRILQAAGAGAPLALALNGSSVYLGQAGGAVLGGLAITAAGLPGAPIAGALTAAAGAALTLAVLRSGVGRPTPAAA